MKRIENLFFCFKRKLSGISRHEVKGNTFHHGYETTAAVNFNTMQAVQITPNLADWLDGNQSEGVFLVSV